MRITAVSGGVGGARFLRGLLAHLGSRLERPENPAAAPDAEPPDPGRAGDPDQPEDDDRVTVTVVANTGDDITLHGLRVCPDIDTLLYTLGGGVAEAQGWGRADESFTVAEELRAYGAGPDWFTLGDRDLATHVLRTRLLGLGHSLSDVTRALCDRWRPGVHLLPMSDDPVETHVVVDDPAAPGGRRAIHLQEWWVRRRAADPARGFPLVGLDRASTAPGVVEALREADVVLLPPSNPVVSIGPVLAMPGVRDALRGTRAPVVGVSPVIGGRPVRGMAAQCLAALDVECSAAGVAGLFADLLDGWLVDSADAGTAPPREGCVVEARPLLMSDEAAASELAAATLRLALRLAA